MDEPKSTRPAAAPQAGAQPEIPLAGGDVTEGVVRIGETVRRPRQPQSAFVEAYLRHLEARGFDGAPRFLGVDERGRDVLTYIDGVVPGSPPEAWAMTDEVLAGVGRLVRRLHDASVGFEAPVGLPWFGRDRVVTLPENLVTGWPAPELVAHTDVTPQNTVFRGGVPVALVDFDMARPTTRLLEVINTAVHWVPLLDPRDVASGQPERAPARLRVLADACGLSTEGRAQFVDLAILGAERSWHLMRANASTLGGGWARMWDEGVGDRIERRRAWLAGGREVLSAALLAQ